MIDDAPVRATDASPGGDDRLGVAVLVVGALAVVGALLGFLWSSLSPTGPRAYVVRPGLFEPDDTEAFIAGDARFLIITAVVGLVAAVTVWLRVRNRTPLVAFALILGALVGALLTEFVGHLSGGGTFDGKTNTIIAALPLSLHMQGLLFVEPAVAALVFGLLAAFANSDDLGHPDPLRPVRPGALVGAGDHPQDGWGHRDAPGALQQGNFPPQ